MSRKNLALKDGLKYDFDFLNIERRQWREQLESALLKQVNLKILSAN